MLHINLIKNGQLASGIFKFKIFISQGQVTSKWVVWSGPKSNSSELLCLSWLTAILMMNELIWRQHFPIISDGNLFRRSRAANSVGSGPIWPKFELLWDFMHVLVTCKYKKHRIKNNREKVETSFSPFISNWGIFFAMETEFWFNRPKTLCSLSPSSVMLHIKFDQYWPTGFRDI